MAQNLCGNMSSILLRLLGIWWMEFNFNTYILPIGWLSATYHLLGEPETTIEWFLGNLKKFTDIQLTPPLRSVASNDLLGEKIGLQLPNLPMIPCGQNDFKNSFCWLIPESHPIIQSGREFIHFMGSFFLGGIFGQLSEFPKQLEIWLKNLSLQFFGELRGVDFSTQSGVVDPPNRLEVAAKDIRLVVDEGETAIYFHHGSGMISWVSKQTLQGGGGSQLRERKPGKWPRESRITHTLGKELSWHESS